MEQIASFHFHLNWVGSYDLQAVYSIGGEAEPACFE